MRKGSGFIPGTPGHAQHSFAKVPSVNVQRSIFDRSFRHLTTFLEGYLYPFYCDEVVPGDTFSARLEGFLRLSTLLQALMDNMYFEVQWWYVPFRLLWQNWIYMQGEQNNTNSSTSFTVPQVTLNAPAALSLFDYLGIPPGINYTASGSQNPNAWFSRAYNFIWNQEYRDQNLQNSVTVDTGNGPDTASNYVLLQRGKRHDYFTSCLPWTQKVNDGTSLNVPLLGTAPVIGLSAQNSTTTITGNSYNAEGGTVGGGTPAWASSNFYLASTGTGAAGPSNYPLLYADLAKASGITINLLRQTTQLQRLFERDARGGTRYPEIIKAHFGVISPDFRLQRPEFLGSSHHPFNIHVVPQSSGTGLTGQTTPQANLASYGTCSVTGSGFTKSFTEHGVIMGICSVRADLTYQQGVERMFLRQTRYDYLMPVLAHLGEQPVYNMEIYAAGGSNDLLTFGYQEQYASYRYKPSQITGEFRSSYSSPLDSWHLAQNFGSLPTLGSSFIVENAPMSRVLASGAVTHFLADLFVKLKSVRPLPLFSVPGGMDRF